jgi:hypothetical protein
MLRAAAAGVAISSMAREFEMSDAFREFLQSVADICRQGTPTHSYKIMSARRAEETAMDLWRTKRPDTQA